MMPDLSPLAYLALVGIAAVALAPYFLIAAIVGSGSLWAIIPGAVWASPFVILPIYWWVKG